MGRGNHRAHGGQSEGAESGGNNCVHFLLDYVLSFRFVSFSIIGSAEEDRYNSNAPT